MKIYGTYLSAPANKVRLAASALDIDADYINLDLTKGEHKTPEYLAVNPLGKVPAIDDNGFYLFESNTICRYMANKVNSPLYPKDVQHRALVDQWMDFSSHHILTNMGKILFNKFFAPMMGLNPNPDSIVEGNRYLDAQIPVIEKCLSNSKMLAGEEMSIADIAMLAALEPFDLIQYDLSPYPAVSAWRNNLMQQAFYLKVHTHYAAEIPQLSS